MKKQKRYFNMVEVALALLVISLGLSTVLTLFPAGLKATAQAENDNNVVEAAECLYTYLQKKDVDDIYVKTRNSPYTGSVSAASGGDRITPDAGNEVYVYRKVTKNGSGPYIEDFSCVAQLFPASGETVYLPALSGTESVAENASDFDDPVTHYFAIKSPDSTNGKISAGEMEFLICNVELSYPATKAYSQRDKRTFRMVFSK